MHPKCRQAVQQAAGRTLTDSEIQKIDDAMSSNMRRLARQDPSGWAAKSNDQRVLEAATAGMQDIMGAAALKVQRAQLQVLRTAGMETRIGDLMANYASGRNRALVHELDQTSLYIEGIKRESMSRLVDLMEAATSKQGAGVGRQGLMYLFDAENPTMSRDLAREIFNNATGVTGNKLAQQGAKAWLDTIEGMRQRFNGAGGDVGRLDYGYLPQPHDQARVRGKGDPGAQADWVQKTLPLLDRRQYVLENGALMNDVEVSALLWKAWETLASGGINKIKPGQGVGRGARANSGAESRQIHFRDADAYLTYLSQYGGGSMYDAMLGHVGGMSRDIGLVERYGPNPEQQMRLQFDLAEMADNGTKRAFGLRPQSYWDVVSGKTGMADNGNIAQIGQDLRNIQTFGKLQGAVLTSVTDLGTHFITTGFNKLSYWDSLKNLAAQASSDTRDFLTMHGIIAETMVSDLNRWSGDNIKNNWSGRIANSTMKLSLMNAWTDTLRRAFSMTMMNGLAKLSKTDWAKLSEYDRWRMTSKGITDADWAVIQQAQLTQYRGAEFLTPESIRASGSSEADRVVAKVLGMITDESEYAVLNPDLATRTLSSGSGEQRGTMRGELARSVMQFKSFPIAMVSRHWRRMMETPQGLEGAPIAANRVAYAGALFASLGVLGAIAYQTKQIVSGKDPADMTTAKFWVKAIAQGGVLSIMGDILLADSTEEAGQYASKTISGLAGPTIGAAADLSLKVIKGNIDKAAAGKETHAGAEALTLARSHIPYVNLWYAKAALDHAGLHALQENLSPGYLSRMQQRAHKDWGQDYWWKPGTGAPDRAPDFSMIGGR
ncbi:hypothetical protein I5R65_07740 [Herbaspirillum sp. AP02]|uniref:hypothetical protein n=1 Tax=unclassified Herbaspirillum TaxID=2624150 RepID=UPI0015DB79A4|nr:MULTISPECIES: hypothetical protein [unclassified Herbaspirillum]MBG7619352.1 hypothetical protein [Herbaspirillum sp. AP02]NZD66636.1 hypothetical protein [Herbaspirillum sp. AP21]